MCGINAAVVLDSLKTQVLGEEASSSALQIQLNDSLDEIEHRGPDARGWWISQDNRIALGYVCLAINDLTLAGEHPFHNESRGIHAVVNGELYESENLRAVLGGLYSFKGNSDCEFVIALYLHYGVLFLSNLRGEFAPLPFRCKKTAPHRSKRLIWGQAALLDDSRQTSHSRV